MRTRPFAVLLLLLLPAGNCAAYPEALFADISSDPAVPRPGEPFELRVLLSESDEEAVEGIELIARIFRADEGAPAPGEEAERVSLSGSGGVYRGQVTTLRQGSYRLSLVELAGGNVQSAASAEFRIDGTSRIESQIVLPAGDGGLGSWLAWLLGLPLLAGLLVVLLLLTGRKRAREAADVEAEE